VCLWQYGHFSIGGFYRAALRRAIFFPMLGSNGSLVVVVVFASLASAQQHCSKINVDRSGGFCTVPDHALTPGDMDPAKVCISNVERPRDVTTAEKNSILAAWGWPRLCLTTILFSQSSPAEQKAQAQILDASMANCRSASKQITGRRMARFSSYRALALTLSSSRVMKLCSQ
jgi:hypothetical protein